MHSPSCACRELRVEVLHLPRLTAPKCLCRRPLPACLGCAGSSGGSGSSTLPGPSPPGMPPPTPPAAHPAPHIGSASESSLASSYPASCSPQLPFAFTPSQHWLASLQEHQVSWLVPVQNPCNAMSRHGSCTSDRSLRGLQPINLPACCPGLCMHRSSLLCCFQKGHKRLWAATCCMRRPAPAPQDTKQLCHPS